MRSLRDTLLDELSAIIKRLRDENAAIVSLNWDLILDQKLFEDGLTSESYGLSADAARVAGSKLVLE